MVLMQEAMVRCIDTQIDGMNVYVNPSLKTNTVLRMLPGTHNEYVVVDSLETLRSLITQANAKGRAQ